MSKTHNTTQGITMKQVSERALFARAKRKMLKLDGTTLRKHKEGNKDYLLGGALYAYSVTEDNVCDWYTNLDDYLEWCRENGVLKADEEIEVKG